MRGRKRVLSEANGSPLARVMLVGEAPGRHGAERTGVPFTGDVSGQRFETLLGAAGWTREDVFVTNAVLCNPRDADGRNRPPTTAELGNCGNHLRATLDVVQPRVVVALGRRALAALHAVTPHSMAADTLPGDLLAWGAGRWIAWLLHPSPLTQTRRSLSQQMADWRRLRTAVDGALAGGQMAGVAESVRPSGDGV